MNTENEVIRELLTELKLSTERMSARLDQTYNSIEKLESTIQKMESAVSSQERRLIILEQSIPNHLISDLALMKDSLDTYRKLMWVVIAAVVGAWAKMYFA